MSSILYKRGTIVEDSEGNKALVNRPVLYRPTEYREVVAAEGTTWWSLANQFYQNTALWFIIAEINLERVADFFTIPAGTKLLIPIFNENSRS